MILIGKTRVFNADFFYSKNLIIGVKRLLKEAMELRTPTEEFCAQPMEVYFLNATSSYKFYFEGYYN